MQSKKITPPVFDLLPDPFPADVRAALRYPYLPRVTAEEFSRFPAPPSPPESTATLSARASARRWKRVAKRLRAKYRMRLLEERTRTRVLEAMCRGMIQGMAEASAAGNLLIQEFTVGDVS